MNGLPRLLQLGDHVCQFFATPEEVGEVLVPYFKEGLERNEACLWITSEPFGKERALSNMRTAAARFESCYAARQIQFLSHEEWYLADGRLKTDSLVPKWHRKIDEALAAGYAGLRATGNASFVNHADWSEFITYERAVTKALSGRPFAAVCSYSHAQCDVDMACQAADCHTFTLRRRCGHWDVFGLRDYLAHLTRHVQGTELTRIVEDRLSAHLRAKANHIELDGERVLLSARKARDLALLFHELATGATEHGAFSSPDGDLQVRWRVFGQESRRLYVQWIESGVGRPVPSPAHEVGAGLMAETVENYKRTLRPSGMVCSFEVALD